MDLLKEEYGTTVLESLVVILLLGIIITLTSSFFSTIINNTNMLKGEALLLAQQEIAKVTNEKSENDTSYTNATTNLKVHRIIYRADALNKVEVMVSKTSSDSLILTLKASYQK